MMKGLTSLMKDSNRNLFFDLDGTILNSEISIRTSLEHSIKKNCPEYLDKINLMKIGPKVPNLLEGHIPSNKIKQVTDDFREYFDNEGFSLTILFPDVVETLLSLKKKFTMNTLTNKPRNISIKILNMLKIDELFNNFYSTYEDNISKGDLIKKLIKYRGYYCFVGDTEEDYNAAMQNNIDFIYCEYGYGINNLKNTTSINYFSDLIDVLNLNQLDE